MVTRSVPVRDPWAGRFKLLHPQPKAAFGTVYPSRHAGTQDREESLVPSPSANPSGSDAVLVREKDDLHAITRIKLGKDAPHVCFDSC